VKPNLQLLKWLFKIGMPVSVAVYLLVPLYGHLNPWPSAVGVLQSYVGQSAILVGLSYKASYTTSASTRRVSRTYVLLPSVFTAPKTVTITQINSEPPTVSHSQYGFLFNLTWLVIVLIGTWWFWLRGGAVQQGIQRDGPASGGSAR
jgi:hypothetical protein